MRRIDSTHSTWLFDTERMRFCRLPRGVDPQSPVHGIEQATALILQLCGGEASEVRVVGQAPAPPKPLTFDPKYPYVPNNTGAQPTFRIADLPILVASSDYPLAPEREPESRT